MADVQAFPAAWGNPEQGGDYVPGMSLRDWFAGQALANARTHFHHEETATPRDVAVQAYAVADAMLEERDQ